jgi:hypothetical protein
MATKDTKQTTTNRPTGRKVNVTGTGKGAHKGGKVGDGGKAFKDTK